MQLLLLKEVVADPTWVQLTIATRHGMVVKVVYMTMALREDSKAKTTKSCNNLKS